MAPEDKKFRRIIVVRENQRSTQWTDWLRASGQEVLILAGSNPTGMDYLEDLRADCVIIDGTSIDATSAGYLIARAQQRDWSRPGKSHVVLLHRDASQLEEAKLYSLALYGTEPLLIHVRGSVKKPQIDELVEALSKE